MGYIKQAEDFLEKTGTDIVITFLERDRYFENDREARNIYNVTLKRNGLRHTFTFGDSIWNTERGIEPTPYDVLATLTKHDVGDFEDFLADFYGQDIPERERKSAYKTYTAAKAEYSAIYDMFKDVMDELEEIM